MRLCRSPIADGIRSCRWAGSSWAQLRCCSITIKTATLDDLRTSPSLLSQVLTRLDAIGEEAAVPRPIRLCLPTRGVRATVEERRNGRWHPIFEAHDSHQQLSSILDICTRKLEKMDATPAIAAPTTPESSTSNLRTQWKAFFAAAPSNAEAHAHDLIYRVFPRLRLRVEKTSGVDLQGEKTRTISVSLVERMPGAALSAAEQEALKNFVGEAAGTSYRRVFCQAMTDAFCAIHQEPWKEERVGPITSVLSLYAEVMPSTTNHPFTVAHGSIQFSAPHVKEGGGTAGDEDVLASETPQTLASLLTTVDRVAAEMNPEKHRALLRRLSTTPPLMLDVDESFLRPARLLRRLCGYYFSIPEDGVQLQTQMATNGVADSRVTVRLPMKELGLAKEDPVWELARSEATHKKRAEDVACVRAMATHFPDIFVQQLSSLPAVKELMEKSCATEDRCPPPLTRGIQPILEWCLGCAQMRFEVESVMLQPGREYAHLGIRCLNTCWRSTLTVVHADGQREVRCVAMDGRRARSENKAIASVLCTDYAATLAHVVAFCRTQKWVDDDGQPGIFHGVAPLSDVQTEEVHQPLISDAWLDELDVEEKPTTEFTTDASKPSALRLIRQSCAELLMPSGESIHEEVSWDSVSQRHVATLQLCPPHESTASPHTLSVGSHSIPEGAACVAYLRLFGGADARFEAAEQSPLAEMLGWIAGLPSQLPLDTAVSFVMSCLTNIVGCSAELRLLVLADDVVAGHDHAVEVWIRSRGVTAQDGEAESHPIMLCRSTDASHRRAAERCLHRLFDDHVLPLICPQRHQHVRRGSCTIPVGDESQLGRVICAVTDEIGATQPGTQHFRSIVQLTFEETQTSSGSGLNCDVVLRVSNEEKDVNLEEATGNTLIACLMELRRLLSVELGIPENPSDGSLPTSAYQRLEHLVYSLVGWSITHESLLIDMKWHCSLLVHLDASGHHCYVLANAIKSRKKDAIEEASRAALAHYFPNVSDSDVQPDTLPQLDGNYILRR